MGSVNDVVIPVRHQVSAPHLALTLRTLEKNFPHKKVWIVGFKPPWVSDEVGYIPVDQGPVGYRNVLFNLLEVVRNDDVDQDFWYFNDDFYVIQKLTEPPVYYEGTLAERARRLRGLALGSYSAGAQITCDLLQSAGFENPLNFDLHAPMPMNKMGVEDSIGFILRSGKDFWPHMRSVYGAMTGLEAQPGKDYKVTSSGGSIPHNAIYLSSSPRSLRGTLGMQLKRLYPEMSKYEREPGV